MNYLAHAYLFFHDLEILTGNMKVKKCQIVLFLILWLYPLLSFSQSNLTGTYYYYNADNSTVENRMSIRLFQNNKKIWYQFYDSYEFYLKDTVINGIVEKIQKIKPADILVGKSGTYTFSVKGTRVYLNYFDIKTKKSFIHAQFPISKTDTTDYINLISEAPIVFGYMNIEGRACYQGDTLITDNKGRVHDTYIFKGFPHDRMHQQIFFSKIFVDKKSLIALRYEYFEQTGKLSYYSSLIFLK